MKKSPFSSLIYISCWLKHFNQEKLGISFPAIKNLLFIKHRFLPLYVNVGKSSTKGLSYSLSLPMTKKHKKKVFLIYDIPQYFNLDTIKPSKGFKLKKIKQYEGFLINLEAYKTLDEYLKTNFSKSRRQKLGQYVKRLNSCFNIQYRMYYGGINEEEYNDIFTAFRNLLVKRFQEKKITNNVLTKKEWFFLKKVSLPMIKEKKASLFVIYDRGQPISIALNFMGEDILFGATTVFDIDYARFNLGYINIMKTTEWCFDNNFKIFDFSKGYFDYKKLWANVEYYFEYHVLYDSTYWPTKILGSFLIQYFTFKQNMRDKNLNQTLQKIKFALLKKRGKRNQNFTGNTIELIKLPEPNTLQKIDMKSPNYNMIKKELFSFLSRYTENIGNVVVFKEKNASSYIFKGEKKIQRIIL